MDVGTLLWSSYFPIYDLKQGVTKHLNYILLCVYTVFLSAGVRSEEPFCGPLGCKLSHFCCTTRCGFLYK
jgi:hypothetical protein